MTRPFGLERPCGTEAAYRRHCLYGQLACQACAEAHRQYQASGSENLRCLREVIALVAAAFTTPPDKDAA